MKATKRERKQLIKMLYSHIYRTMSDARIECISSYDDTLLAKIDRIEAYAYAAMVSIVEGL
jgi:hypothetical protein